MKKLLALIFLGALLTTTTFARGFYSLNDKWGSVCFPEGKTDSIEVQNIQLPHNWDDYYGYRQYLHGNLHGKARYERRFTLFGITKEGDASVAAQQLYMLHLEGAGSYVSVWVNGKEVCNHKPAGRVVTSLDITEYLNTNNPKMDNRLVIECDHPSNITDLPWVCGGCSAEWGFSEGSEPFGLFRNVTLEVSDMLRVEPFGVHAWANESLDTIFVDTEVHNYHNHGEICVVQTAIEGRLKKETFELGARLSQIVRQAIPMRELKLQHWSLENPQLYTVQTTVMKGRLHEVVDRIETEVGFSEVKWPARSAEGRLNDEDHRFYLNGEPVYLHGVCEYEHLFGQSHALSREEIDYRCKLIKHMGFNAFRDAHQPHNLRYQENWAKMGMLWWPQFSAHIWYDTPQFRENFKTLLRQWVKERRNNPAIMLWGLQNESTLPEDFSRECADIIREMDPKCRPVGNAANGRLITTCNGGSGTDWNVIQNWSGTYGGTLDEYGDELSRDDQLLNGEYGGWRTVGLHDKQDRLPLSLFVSNAPWSEEHQCALLHAKLSQAYENRERLCGQFQWILASHDNPGRQQPDEFLRSIDKVGPFNYKGLLTATWEPTDAYYLYVAWGAFLRNEWPEGVDEPMKLLPREVVTLGYLYEGIPLPDYLLDETASEDCSRPDLHTFAERTSSLAPEGGRVYLYRYNCGGDKVVDSYGNVWMGDDTRYSYSWAMAPQFADDNLCPVLGSQSVLRGWALDPIQKDGQLLASKVDQPLLRNYRYGRHELRFKFPLPTGPLYQVDLWFVNSRHYVSHVSYTTMSIQNGQLYIGFPHVKIGQAKVSAIAISVDEETAKKLGKMGPRGTFVFSKGQLDSGLLASMEQEGYPINAGMNWAQFDFQTVEKTDKASLPEDKGGRPSAKYDVNADGVSFDIKMGLAQEYALRFRYKNVDSKTPRGHWTLLSSVDSRLVAEGDISFPPTPAKFKTISTTTGTFVNAGSYRLVLSDVEGVEFENVEVQ